MTANNRGIIAWWANNAVAANLLMLAAFIVGFIGYVMMERETFPTVGFNGATIRVSWPGASPRDVEEQIILRLEEAVADLEGVEEISAFAREGYGSVSVEARRDIDMSDFINDLSLRVDGVNNLPPSAFRPTVTQWESQEWYMGVAIHGDIDLLELKRIADQVRDEMANLPGGSRATAFGILGEEVSIELSEEAMRRYGLTFDEVARAIRGSSVNSSAGRVRTETGDVQLNSRSLADTANDFESIIVRQEPGGATIRVGDVARVIDGFVDANLEATFQGESAAIVALVATENNMNVVRTARAVNEYIEEAEGRFPEGVSFSIWWDGSKIYTDRMTTIATSAFVGLALVFITLILFLRPMVAFWVTIGIATAFAGTFALLLPMGVSLNMLSLFAFLLVVGIVVDDAIIVGENIHNMVERGERGVTAAILGTQLVAKPVVFAVITSMMAFAPWMLLSGPEVNFTRQISLVVIAALTFSLIESLLILPAHLAHMKPQRKHRGAMGGLMAVQRGFASTLVGFSRRLYRPVIETAIRARYATFTLFVAMFVVTIAAMNMGYVRFAFMPEVENEFIQANISMPDGTPWNRVLEVREQFQNAQDALAEEYIERYGAEQPLVETRNAIASNTQVQAWIGLAPPEVRPGGVSTREVTERLTELLGPIPDAEDVRLAFTMNQSGPELAFALFSSNEDDLRAAADDLENQLRTYGSVFNVRDNFSSSTDEALFTLQPGAEALGLTLQEVVRQVGQAYFGELVQRLPRAGDDVEVRVRYPTDARRSLDTVYDLRIRLPDGREVPFSSVAEVEFAPGVSTIRRLERQRSATVTAEVEGDEAGQIRENLDETFWAEWSQRHPGVTRELTGDSQGEQEFLAEIMVLQIIMFFAMYFLLAVAFKSYFQPILVMTAIPFALVGAVIGHYLYDIPLALFSFFGVGAAAGVVINDNLVLIDYVNRLRARGVNAFRALVSAGVTRFRPILLTSVTTYLGVLPMIAERSTQAQFLKPMVIALAFAVLFALLLTLVLVPALYAIGSDIARLSRWAWKGEPLRFIGRDYDPREPLAGLTGDIDSRTGDDAEDRPDGGYGGARPAPAE